MLIICPKCFAQYAISDEISIQKGQKFHCSACQNYFVLSQNESMMGEEDADIIPTVSSVMQAANQPSPAVMGIPVAAENLIDNNNYQGEHKEKNTNSYIKETGIGGKKAVLQSTSLSSQTILPVTEETIDSDSAVEKALSALAKETPKPSLFIDTIPEEFKPVQKDMKKKTSFLSAFAWLIVALGICYGAYLQKDFLIAQVDSFILTQLDKSNKTTSATPKKENKVQKNNMVADVSAEEAVEDKNEIKPEKVSKSLELQETQENSANEVIKEPISLVEKANNTEPAPILSLPNEKQAPVQEEGVISVETVDEIVQNNRSQLKLSNLPEKIDELPSLGLPERSLPDLTKKEQLDENIVKPFQKTVREQAVISKEFAPLAEASHVSVEELNDILKIQNISYAIAPNEVGIYRLMIKGEVVNTELKTLVIPEMKAVVYNESDEVIARKRIVLSQAQIEGNSVQPFFSSVVPAPLGVKRVEVVFDE